MNPRFKENMGLWFTLVSISKLSHTLAILVVFDLKRYLNGTLGEIKEGIGNEWLTCIKQFSTALLAPLAHKVFYCYAYM